MDIEGPEPQATDIGTHGNTRRLTNAHTDARRQGRKDAQTRGRKDRLTDEDAGAGAKQYVRTLFSGFRQNAPKICVRVSFYFLMDSDLESDIGVPLAGAGEVAS